MGETYALMGINHRDEFVHRLQVQLASAKLPDSRRTEMFNRLRVSM
jgi:hypothetical protein